MSVSKLQVTKLNDSVQKVIDKIGGINKFIKKGDKVLIKPNFNTADPFPASSDVEFIEVVVDLVNSIGAEAIIGESSTLTLSTERVMSKKDIYRLQDKAKIINFDKNNWVNKEIPNGKYLKKVSVPKILEEVDKLILLPCNKTHNLARYTGSLKLSVGFMKPVERVPLHARYLEEKIGELNRVINPDLIIMDSRKVFITLGPSRGEVREPNLILASVDRVGIDIEGMKIIQGFEGNSLSGIIPEESTQIKIFQK